MRSFEPGSRFGDLRIERELGHGAFGRVYLALDTLLGRKVALKVFHAPAGVSEADRKRTLEEARLIGRLNDPHVVTLYHVHQDADLGLVFEMEYLDGGTLQDLLEAEGELEPGERPAIVRGLARGLQAAHEAGIVHGDVKPRNVLLERATRRPKLADFGLSRLVHEASLRRGSSASPVGTPRFMSPEVIMGHRPGVASDIWGVGVLFYLLLAGHLPFRGGNLNAVFQAVLNAEPAPLGPDVPPHHARLALDCLRKDPRDRPSSCAELLARLAEGEPAGVDVAVPHPAGAALHGRTAELEAFDGWLAAVSGGASRNILVTGEAGVGKTTLMQVVGARAERCGFRWAEVAVSPVEGLLRPLVAALRRLLPGSGLADEPGSSASAVRGIVLADEAGIESREQVVWAIERLVRELAREKPLGLLVEDAQLGGAEDLRLITDLALRLRAAPCLLAVTHRLHDAADSARSDGLRHAELAARPEFEHIELGPLAPGSLLDLLEADHAGRSLDPEVAHRVVTLSEGNPLYAKQLLTHMLEEGFVEARGNRLVARADRSSRELPRRIREVVRIRLEGLAETTRSILDVAALDGLEFDGEAVAAVLEQPLLNVLRALQELYRSRGLVVPRGEAFRFAHALIHEVIEADIAPPLRREVSRRLAEHLEARPDDVDPVRLGLHWERAGEIGRARPHLIRAASDPDRYLGARRTVDLFARAGLAPDRLDAALAGRHADELLSLAEAYFDLSRPEEGEAVYARILEAAAEAGDESQRLKTVVRRSKMRFFYRGKEAIDEQDLRAAAKCLPDSRERALALYNLGLLAKYRGEFATAESLLRDADAVYLRIGHAAGHSSALDQLGSVARGRGRSKEAERLYAEAARVARRVGRRTNAAVSEVNRCLIAFDAGRLDELPAALEDAVRTFELEGAPNQAAHAMLILGQVRFALGDLRAAAGNLTRARDALERTGYLPALAGALQSEAYFALLEGRLDDAGRLVENACDAARRFGRDSTIAHVRATSGLFHALAGRPDRAREEFRRVLATVQAGKAGGAAGELLFGLLEAVLLGLPAAGLLDGEEFDSGLDDEVAGRLAAAIRVLAAETPDSAPLASAAALLLDSDAGYQRALRRLCGHWLSALACECRGDLDGARAAAREAQACATKLGHRPAVARLRDLSGRLERV